MPARAVASRREWLEWLSRVRLFGISLALVIELLATYSHTANAPTLAPFLALVAFWYLLACGERLLLRCWASVGPQVYLQLSLDVLLLAALIGVSGGVDSPLTQIYVLVVIVAALLLPRGLIYTLAGLCVLAYWGAAEVALYPPLYRLDPGLVNYGENALVLSVLLNGIAFFAAAYLAELLAGKLKAAGEELQAHKHVLASLRALNDNIVHSMSGGLLTTDLAGRIYLANAAAARILERPAEELVGRQVEEVFGPIPEEMLGQRGELQRLCGGRDKIIGLTVVALQVPGAGDAGRVFHFQDLTELRRLERELRVRDRMAALGRMAAGIAHEIRNPLASLAGSVQLLARYASLNEEQRRLVAIVGRESERLNRIIGDFLGYARDYRYRMAAVDLRETLTEVLALASHGGSLKMPRAERAYPAGPALRESRAAATNGSVPERSGPAARADPGGALEIVADLGEAPIPVWADADRLKQIFWNLCDNARKAMPGGGRLRVNARPSLLGVRVEFQDEGCGLAPGSEEEIFEPFRGGFGEGTGLGLATTYAIAMAHEGKIWAESPPEGGTRFVLQLPLDRRALPRQIEIAVGAEAHEPALLQSFRPSR